MKIRVYMFVVVVPFLLVPSLQGETFTDNGNGTVTDTDTGLVWQRCSAGQNDDTTCTGTASTHTWQTALNYCNGLNLAGKAWRLPSIEELKSILDKGRANPPIDTAFFPATKTGFYWTSTTYASFITSAWVVYYGSFAGSGSAAYALKTSNLHYVRCVAN